ncbi:MAG: hypothetical protein ACT4N4_11105, partial [Rhodospirillales bacterium]
VLLLLLWMALALAPQRREAWRPRLAAAAAGTALAAFCLWFLFPHLFRPGTAVFGAELGLQFWGLIDEMRPAYRDLGTLLLLMGGPAIGLAAAIGFAATRSTAHERAAWAWLAVMQAALMIPGLLHARFAVYPQVLGALPAAALLARIGPVMERVPVPAMRLPARALAVALIAVAPVLTSGLASGLAGKNRLRRTPPRPTARCAARQRH